MTCAWPHDEFGKSRIRSGPQLLALFPIQATYGLLQDRLGRGRPWWSPGWPSVLAHTSCQAPTQLAEGLAEVPSGEHRLLPACGGGGPVPVAAGVTQEPCQRDCLPGWWGQGEMLTLLVALQGALP